MANVVISALKVKFSANSSEFKKDMDEGGAAVTHFAGEAKNSFGEFAKLFGVNLGDVGDKMEGFQKSLSVLSGSFKGATAGSGGLSGALNILKVALISTGIGALIVALGSLVTYFTASENGGDKLAVIMARIGAATKVLVDKFAILGSKVMEAFENPKQAITDLWEFIKSQFVNRITALPLIAEKAFGLVKKAINGSISAQDFKELGQAVIQLQTGFDAVQQNKIGNYFAEVGNEIVKEANRAAELAKALDALEEKESNLRRAISDRSLAQAKARMIAKDDTKSIYERLKANDEAARIEKQNLADQVYIAGEKKRILEEQLKLRENDADSLGVSQEAYDEVTTAQEAYNQLQIDSITLQKKLMTERNTLMEQFRKENAAPEAMKPMVIDMKIDTKTLKKGMGVVMNDLNKFQEEFKAVFIDIGAVITQALSDVAVGFGEAIGKMMAGTGGLKDIKNLVFSAIGSILVTLGKLAIETGIGVLAIKKSLQSLNPYVAIAAGVALIALGTYVSTSVANTGNSIGGSSGGGGGSTYSGVSTFDTRPTTSNKTTSTEPVTVNVNVQGTLKGKGSDLYATVKTEGNRRTLTT